MTGFAAGGRGVWCTDASPGAVARLARAGFDWIGLDAQHGLYARTEIVEVARAFPGDVAELVVRVASLDSAAVIGVPRALLRTALIALVLPALARDEDGRGWHDRATRTVVVRSRA